LGLIPKSQNIFWDYNPNFVLLIDFLSQKEAEEQRRFAKLQGKNALKSEATL